jgi:hypothetical protein
MDRSTVIKLLAGTLARGILWAAGALSAKLGVDSLSRDTAEGVAYFAASVIVAGVAAWWSSRKDRRLLMTPPPVTNQRGRPK